MAELVFAAGVPHTPAFPSLIAAQGPGSPTLAHFDRVRQLMEAARPELIVLISTDHLNTFFFDNLPLFAIGVDDRFSGPNDDVPGLPPREVVSDRTFARHLRAAMVEAGFDPAHVEHCELDHSFMVPLKLLAVPASCRIVPVFLCGHVPPLPAAARCHCFGQAIRDAILASEQPRRVGVIASGSFSLYVHGSRTAPGQAFGVPDPAWVAAVGAMIAEGRVADLVAATTAERLEAAGNVAGEILNWIAMLACTGSLPPEVVSSQDEFGHGYAAWRLDGR